MATLGGILSPDAGFCAVNADCKTEKDTGAFSTGLGPDCCKVIERLSGCGKGGARAVPKMSSKSCKSLSTSLRILC